MNYLVHTYLSGPDAGDILGNLVGDFVKGPLDGRYRADIEEGIHRHRRLDTFAQTNDAFRRSRLRIDPRFGHCRGVMVDIFYDHVLATTWSRHSPIPLEVYCRDIYRLIEMLLPLLPPSFQSIAPRMISGDWLVSYRDAKTIDIVLKRISQRLRKTTPMAEGISELLRNRDGLEEDFEAFLEDGIAFMGTV